MGGKVFGSLSLSPLVHFSVFSFFKKGRVGFLFYVCVCLLGVFFHAKKLESAMCVYIIYTLCALRGEGEFT